MKCCVVTGSSEELGKRDRCYSCVGLIFYCACIETVTDELPVKTMTPLLNLATSPEPNFSILFVYP